MTATPTPTPETPPPSQTGGGRDPERTFRWTAAVVGVSAAVVMQLLGELTPTLGGIIGGILAAIWTRPK